MLPTEKKAPLLLYQAKKALQEAESVQEKKAPLLPETKKASLLPEKKKAKMLQLGCPNTQRG